MGFKAAAAPIVDPTNPDQVKAQYEQSQMGLEQQNNFIKALNLQNGLGNQSSVFNQQQAVANGTGPNPAQAQLAQATGANVANQAAMMASQRGSGANAGMMARQAGMAGSNIQQQAAGQAATLQAQQSLGALGQMGNMATSQANQQANATNAYAQNALTAQQNILGAQGAFNNAQVGSTSSQNAANAGIAGHVAGAQGNMMGNMMGGIGSAFQMIGGGGGGGEEAGGLMAGGAGDSVGEIGGEMLAAEGGQVPEPSVWDNIKKAFQEPDQDKKPRPTPTPGSPDYDKAKAFMKGGHFADGGDVETPLDPMSSTGPQSNVGKSFMQSQDDLGAASSTAPQAPIDMGKGPDPMSQMMGQASKIGGAAIQDIGKFGNWIGKGLNYLGDFGGSAGSSFEAAMPAAAAAAPEYVGAGMAEAAPYAAAVAAKGGMAKHKVPAMVSPGETYLDKKEVKKVAKGADPLEIGEKIPGKPKVKGNSYANDTVPKTLEAGGVVIPNSIMQSKDAEKKAAAFVKAILAKQGLKKSLSKGK